MPEGEDAADYLDSVLGHDSESVLAAQAGMHLCVLLWSSVRYSRQGRAGHHWLLLVCMCCAAHCRDRTDCRVPLAAMAWWQFSAATSVPAPHPPHRRTVAPAGVKHVELDAYMFTHAARTVAYQRPDDTFYVCDGAGECGGPGASQHLPGQQWGLGQISAPQAWSVTKGSKGVKVRPSLQPHVDSRVASLAIRHSRSAILTMRLRQAACTSDGRNDHSNPIRMSLPVCSDSSRVSIQTFTESPKSALQMM